MFCRPYVRRRFNDCYFFCVFQGRNWIFRENYLFGLFMFINQSSKYIYCCRRGWPNDKYVFKMTTNLLKRTTMCYLKNVQHIATFTNYFRQACNLFFFFANWKKSNFENFYWNITLRYLLLSPSFAWASYSRFKGIRLTTK